MKKVDRYETKDGQLFETAEQAEDWERFLVFQNWYEARGNSLTGITASGMSRWLSKHRDEVMLFYSSAGHVPDGCSD